MLVDMKRQKERDGVFGGGEKDEEEKIDLKIDYK